MASTSAECDQAAADLERYDVAQRVFESLSLLGCLAAMAVTFGNRHDRVSTI